MNKGRAMEAMDKKKEALKAFELALQSAPENSKEQIKIRIDNLKR